MSAQAEKLASLQATLRSHIDQCIERHKRDQKDRQDQNAKLDGIYEDIADIKQGAADMGKDISDTRGRVVIIGSIVIGIVLAASASAISVSVNQIKENKVILNKIVAAIEGNRQ